MIVGSYSETSTHTAIYKYHHADNEKLTSFTFVFSFKRTGTWELKYENGMDIQSQAVFQSHKMCLHRHIYNLHTWRGIAIL